MRVAKCHSHRARERLFAALNRKPRFRPGECYHGAYYVTDDEATLRVKGVTIMRGLYVEHDPALLLAEK